eukprot:Platyproteum_vivax@DN6424_c0_g1_i1.p1
MDKLTFSLAEKVSEAMEDLPKPVLVQCHTARRASAVVTLSHISTHPKMNIGDLAEYEKGNCIYKDKEPLCGWVDGYLRAKSMPLDEDMSESSTYTYLLADPASREAVLIDPVLEQVPRDVQLCNQLGLKLVYAINTHVHADHITGTGALKQLIPGLESVLGAGAASAGAQADLFVKHDDRLYFGERYLQVRNTPGHTQACVSLVTDDGMKAFTGDALLIRGCGRIDFNADEVDAATQLTESVVNQIFTLPDLCGIYPGHDYKGVLMSTVIEEKKYNKRFARGAEGLRKIMKDLNLPKPNCMDTALKANMVDGLLETPEGYARCNKCQG